MDGDEKADIRELVMNMLRSPIIIAIVSGVIIGASGLYQAMTVSGASTVFDACTAFISAPTSAIIAQRAAAPLHGWPVGILLPLSSH